MEDVSDDNTLQWNRIRINVTSDDAATKLYQGEA